MSIRSPYPYLEADFISGSYSAAHTFTAASEAKSLIVETDRDSTFVLQKLMYQATAADFTCTFRRNSYRYSNEPVNEVNQFGTGTLPKTFLDPIIIPPGGQFYLDLTNGATAANATRFHLQGLKVYDPAKAELLARRMRSGDMAAEPMEFFQYVANITLTASQQLVGNILTDRDADFVCRRIVGDSTGNFSAKILDYSSAHTEWFDGQIRQGMWLGSAQYPNDIHPRIIPAGTVISVDAIDLSVAANTIQIVFEGYKKKN